MAPNKTEYDPLATEDAPEHLERLSFEPAAQKSQHGTRWLIATLLATIAALITTTAILSTRPQTQSLPQLTVDVNTASPYVSSNSEGPPSPASLTPQPALRQPCGTTAAEAEARNCHFDMIRLAWLPDACKDASLLAEFDTKVAGIPFFWDKAGTIPLAAEDMAWATGEFWSWRVFHKHHCAYSLMKMHRALAAGRRVDSKMHLKHTRHCTLNLMNDTVPNEVVWAKVKKISFPDCIPVADMLQDPSEEF
ncbi:hypothetical protein MMC10_006621 [Thelotrema lepadinum]|nr:hypothetical protein [Thelotrema lepadinum]